MTEKITLRKPDDFHIHLRDGLALATTVRDAAPRFQRIAVMPNLVPPVSTVDQALAYRERILQHSTHLENFNPLMMLYLTANTTTDTVQQAAINPYILAFKLYPAGATTHSDAGISSFQQIEPLLACMEAHDVPLAIHGEVTTPTVDIFEREQTFIDTVLFPITQRFPKLRISLEHISTRYAVEFILSMPQHVVATITAHHLLLNRNDLLVGGIKPHHYCLPIVKTQLDQEALLKAAISGNPKFFLGSDSAPHAKHAKESACGCAGIYTAHAGLELYAEIFQSMQALDKLENFSSVFGAQFYKLPLNAETITLIKQPWTVPHQLSLGEDPLIPFRAGQTINWQLAL